MTGSSGKMGLHELLRTIGHARKTQSSRLFRPDSQGGNRGLVITICMVTAFGLWLLLSMDDPGEVRLELATAIDNQPANRAFAEIPPSSVMASVQGEVLTLLKLKFRPPPFTIDASQDVVESQSAVQWPQGIVAQFDSPQIALIQEERSQRTMPVVSAVNMQAAVGYSLFDEPSLMPDSVTVTGAASIVGRLTGWPTVPLRRSDVKDSLTVEVPLADSLAGLVALSHHRVTLTVRTHKYTEGIRELRVLVTDIPNAESVVDLDPPKVAVIFHAPLDQFGAVRAAEDFYATVSYEAIRLDTTGSVVPVISLPRDLSVRHVGTQPLSLNYYVNTGLQ